MRMRNVLLNVWGNVFAFFGVRYMRYVKNQCKVSMCFRGNFSRSSLYLTSRKQMIRVKGTLLTPCSPACGVVQMIVPGPLPFLIYIGNIPRHRARCTVTFFERHKTAHAIHPLTLHIPIKNISGICSHLKFAKKLL